MTLSDLLTYLRARHGGQFYSDVAEKTGISTLRLVRAERSFSVPDLTPDEIDRLAEHFGVPVEVLRAARPRARGDLTSYLAGAEKKSHPIVLRLQGDAEVTGPIVWRDRHAVAVRQPDKSVRVVYRSSVQDWGNPASGVPAEG